MEPTFLPATLIVLLFPVFLCLSTVPAFASGPFPDDPNAKTLGGTADTPPSTDAPGHPTSSAAAPMSRPAAMPALYVASALLHGFDAFTTMRAIDSGGVEANPLMRGTVSHPIAFVAIKSGVTVASILAAERLWKNHHPTAAVVTMLASNGFMAWVAVHNASIVFSPR